MEPMFLKPEIIEQIKSDPILQAKIAQALGVALPTMYKVLAKENNPRLTQISVLHVLRDHLKIKKDSDLLTEMAAV